MTKIFISQFLLFSIFAFSQIQNKIDSTFNHYFKVLDLELNENKNIADNINLFDEITLENGEKAYVSKYSNKALFFLEKITKIKAPTRYIGQTKASFVDKITLDKWKKWYLINKGKIRWCKKRNKPYM